MPLTEKDIFKYVFFRETLENAKVQEIEGDTSLQNEIQYYADLKEQLSTEISDSAKKRLDEMIQAYNLDTIISLQPIKVQPEAKSIKLLKYAAATEENETGPVITFANENKDYLIRLHKMDEKYKIFLFSTIQDKLEHIELTFFPSKEIISIKDNQNPFTISLSQFPDKIDMKLN